MYAFEVVISELPEEVAGALKPALGRTSLDKTKGAIRTEIAVLAYPEIDIESLPLTPLTKEEYAALVNGPDYTEVIE